MHTYRRVLELKHLNSITAVLPSLELGVLYKLGIDSKLVELFEVDKELCRILQHVQVFNR